MVGSVVTKITRHFSRQEDAKKLHGATKNTVIECLRSGSSEFVGVASGKVAVDKWITAHIGPMSSFLLSCMVSQNADADFFNMSPADQKELLDGAMNIGTHTRYMELLKESRLAHIAISDLVGATMETIKRSMTTDTAATSATSAACMDPQGRIKELDLAISEAALGTAVMHAGKLEPRSHYEDICQGGGCGSLTDLTFELETLKRDRNKASLRVGGALSHDQKWYEDELKALVAMEPEVIGTNKIVPTTYDEAAFALALLAASDIDVAIFKKGTRGNDAGPYNNKCKCCVARKGTHELAGTYATWISQWTAKKEWLESCISMVKVNAIQDLEARVANAANRESAAAILTSYDAIEKSQLVTSHMLERQRLDDLIKSRTRQLKEMSEWSTYKAQLDARIVTFGTIYKIMDGFVAWLYNGKVLPDIALHTNQLMALIDPDLKLSVGMSTEGIFEWSLNNIVTMEKASGFQRFLCGLAVRIALGSVGAAGVKPTQLFLDEGFTSCDQSNLTRVPKMLRTMLQLFDSIVLVTHLEELKDSGNVSILIERNAQGQSKLVHI
jgi:DNA repair exonuclease SbcCD ATPase subunit